MVVDRDVAPSTLRVGSRQYWRAVVAEVSSDGPIYLLIGAYALAVVAAAVALGVPEKLAYLSRFGLWLVSVLAIGALYLIVVELPPSFRKQPDDPLMPLIARAPDLFNPRFVAGGVLVLSIAVFMGCFTSAKNMLPDLAPYRWDTPLANLDASLHGGTDPWRLLQPVLGYRWVTRALQQVYLPGWLVVLCGGSAVVAVSRRMAVVRRRFFVTYLATWIILGNLVAAAFMSAGPVYYGKVTGDASRFADQIDYLSFSAGLTNSSVDLQGALWYLYEAHRVELGTGISAFPSLHIAIATLFALLAWPRKRIARWGTVAFVVLMLVASVHLGWHYAIDGYVAIVATMILWSVTSAIRGAPVASAPPR